MCLSPELLSRIPPVVSWLSGDFAVWWASAVAAPSLSAHLMGSVSRVVSCPRQERWEVAVPPRTG